MKKNSISGWNPVIWMLVLLSKETLLRMDYGVIKDDARSREYLSREQLSFCQALIYFCRAVVYFWKTEVLLSKFKNSFCITSFKSLIYLVKLQFFKSKQQFYKSKSEPDKKIAALCLDTLLIEHRLLLPQSPSGVVFPLTAAQASI